MESGLKLMHAMAVSLLRLALLAEICKEIRNVLSHDCVQLCHWRSPPKPIFGQWKAMNIYTVQLNSEFPER